MEELCKNSKQESPSYTLHKDILGFLEEYSGYLVKALSPLLHAEKLKGFSGYSPSSAIPQQVRPRRTPASSVTAASEAAALASAPVRSEDLGFQALESVESEASTLRLSLRSNGCPWI